jgi:hypothetical protein
MAIAAAGEEDAEIAAKSAFAAAKYNQNSFSLRYDLFGHSSNAYLEPIESINHDYYDVYGKYYELLAKDLDHTDYYQDVIQECNYFKRYVETELK